MPSPPPPPERYRRYMQSRQWPRKKLEWKQNSGRPYICVVCEDRRGVQLHHVSYQNFGNEKLEDLEPLCKVHHAQIHTLHRAGILLTLDPNELISRMCGPSAEARTSKGGGEADTARGETPTSFQARVPITQDLSTLSKLSASGVRQPEAERLGDDQALVASMARVLLSRLDLADFLDSAEIEGVGLASARQRASARLKEAKVSLRGKLKELDAT